MGNMLQGGQQPGAQFQAQTPSSQQQLPPGMVGNTQFVGSVEQQQQQFAADQARLSAKAAGPPSLQPSGGFGPQVPQQAATVPAFGQQPPQPGGGNIPIAQPGQRQPPAAGGQIPIGPSGGGVGLDPNLINATPPPGSPIGRGEVQTSSISPPITIIPPDEIPPPIPDTPPQQFPIGGGQVGSTITPPAGSVAQIDVRTGLIKELEQAGFGQLSQILGGDFLGMALGGNAAAGGVPGQQAAGFGPAAQGLQGTPNFLQGLGQFGAPGAQTSGLQQGTSGAIGQFGGQLGQVGGFQGSALGGAATQSLLGGLGGGGPEQQIFQQAQQQLGGGINPGQGVVDALQPIFQDQLSRSLGDLSNAVPSVFNSATAQQGADLQRQSMQDFNLLAAQALQQGGAQQTQNLGLLGQLAGQAGGAGFGRALQAGQLGLGQSQAQTGAEQFGQQSNVQNFLAGQQNLLGAGQLGLGQSQLQTQGGQAASQQGLQALLGGQQGQQGLIGQAQQQQQFGSQFGLAQQNQAFNQTSGPALQLLMQALGIADPTALQTVVTPRDADQ